MSAQSACKVNAIYYKIVQKVQIKSKQNSYVMRSVSLLLECTHSVD